MSKCEVDENCMPGSLPIRVVIIEDNKFIRRGWEILLNKQLDFRLIGSYGSFEDAENQKMICQADLVIMDLQLPGLSGIEGIKKIKSCCPEVIVVVCTAYEDNEEIFETITAGAFGFIEKKASEDEMLFFLRNAMKGISPMSPNIARKLLTMFKDNNKTNSIVQLHGSVVEKRLLQKISEGKTYAAAAQELNMNLTNVMQSITGIYKKLQNGKIEKI